jgi:hypothetical protein
MQLHLFEPDLYAKPSGEVGQLPISGKQCQRHSPFAILVENFDGSTPAFALTVVNLSKVEHLALNDLTTPTTAILDDVSIAMLFAVFDPRMVPEEHYGHRFYSPLHQWERALVCTTQTVELPFLHPSALAGNLSRKIALFDAELRKLG